MPPPCSLALPQLLLPAENPAAAASSSSLGAVLRCWLCCLGGSQHSPANSCITRRVSGQGSSVRSRGDPFPCHAGGWRPVQESEGASVPGVSLPSCQLAAR